MTREEHGDYWFVVNLVRAEQSAWEWKIYSSSSGIGATAGYALSDAEAKHAARNWITRQRAKAKFKGDRQVPYLTNSAIRGTESGDDTG
jgi:hypothetical protein